MLCAAAHVQPTSGNRVIFVVRILTCSVGDDYNLYITESTTGTLYKLSCQVDPHCHALSPCVSLSAHLLRLSRLRLLSIARGFHRRSVSCAALNGVDSLLSLGHMSLTFAQGLLLLTGVVLRLRRLRLSAIHLT